MKYISYLRVSTKEQGTSGLGLEAQREIIKHYCSDGIIVEEFSEVASGKGIDRPKLQEAIKEALSKDAVLVVAKLDRLSRDVEHTFKIHKQLREGKLFKSCDLPSSDTLTLSIFSGLAQREREIISIRTKLALKQKKKAFLESKGIAYESYLAMDKEEQKAIHQMEGYPLGGKRTFNNSDRAKGSRVNRRKALDNKNNNRAMELISMYREKGLTYEEIANKLNAQSFVSPRGKAFHKTTVMRLYKRFQSLQTV